MPPLGAAWEKQRPAQVSLHLPGIEWKEGLNPSFHSIPNCNGTYIDGRNAPP